MHLLSTGLHSHAKPPGCTLGQWRDPDSKTFTSTKTMTYFLMIHKPKGVPSSQPPLHHSPRTHEPVHNITKPGAWQVERIQGWRHACQKTPYIKHTSCSACLHSTVGRWLHTSPPSFHTGASRRMVQPTFKLGEQQEPYSSLRRGAAAPPRAPSFSGRELPASPARAAPDRYSSASCTRFTFSCSWTRARPYFMSTSRVMRGFSNCTLPSRLLIRRLPRFSTPRPLTKSRTLSSYTRARRAPKKSMDWPGKVSTSLSTSWRVTWSSLKMPMHTPMRSSRVGFQ
mmetsp:Transcript_38945/g.86622  ORF Transcript_38945/g.86622 Transcript_38945/m.86622 type:complete len:283 (-) Transcript_38945:883-1731(-)